MKIYKVGGVVRDMLLGVPPQDKDYVVVGSTIEEMLSLGFKQVGCGFPVFLHPETNEEYALARKETKTGDKYTDFDLDFSPSTTLQEDLFRRDLTINAVAYDPETKEFIDYFGGIEDIKNKVLRPVSYHFMEDPIRILRLARFRARLGYDWKIDTTLGGYIQQLYSSGDLENLFPERIWLETQKALKESYVELYFETLKDLGIFPEIDALEFIPPPLGYHPENYWGEHIKLVLKYANKTFNDPEVNFAVLMHDVGKALTYRERKNLHGHEEAGVGIVNSFCDRLKVPNKYRDLALITTEYHTHCHMAFEMKAKSIMKLFEKTNALTKRDRFNKFLQACEADKKGRGEPACHQSYTEPYFLDECLTAVLSIDTKQLSQKMLSQGKSGSTIGEAIRVARINAIRNVINKWGELNAKGFTGNTTSI